MGICLMRFIILDDKAAGKVEWGELSDYPGGKNLKTKYCLVKIFCLFLPFC